MNIDFLVVGSGLTGAVIARALADTGSTVLVLERRSHLGGNLHHHTHPSGIKVHTYGPHYFRTNSERIWAFVGRFASFYKFEAVLKSHVDGRLENWPVAASYIRRIVGESWAPSFQGEPANFEEASLAMMPRLVYEKFVKGYTEKQWGVPANSLSAGLAKRFDIRHDDEPRLMRHKFQGLPADGYSAFMSRMLAGIPVMLNCDYLRDREQFKYRKMLIFTGPIDEYFGFHHGRLKYRGQQREHEYRPEVEGFIQPCIQVNNPHPEGGRHIRTLEWKHLMPPELAAHIRGTVLTRETTVTPDDPNHYEYPFPDEANQQLYKRYRDEARLLKDVLICGRLGEYRYYDMDQAIARAQLLAERILQGASQNDD